MAKLPNIPPCLPDQRGPFYYLQFQLSYEGPLITGTWQRQKDGSIIARMTRGQMIALAEWAKVIQGENNVKL